MAPTSGPRPWTPHAPSAPMRSPTGSGGSRPRGATHAWPGGCTRRILSRRVREEARMRSIALSILAVLTLAIPAAAKAADKAKAEPFAAVLECRKLTDDKARLACYDAATGR